MQRRAAAIYAVFFLVIGTASYSLIATAHAPSVEFDNPDHRLQQGDTFRLENEEYNVSSIQATAGGGGGGGGHGGGGGGGDVTRSGTITWVNESSQYTATWENNTSVTLQNQSYTVLLPNSSDPNQFTLRENINRSAILQNDSQADNSTVTRNGQEYVVVTSNGSTTLVPVSEYFPEPNRRQFSEGQQFQYQGNATTVSNVTNQSATLAWTAPRENSVELSNNANVTIGNTTYLAHFPNNQTVVLTSDFETYDRQTQRIATFNEQKSGLWGITILSGLTVVFLLGMAYLPSRY